ncbi:tetratricopeptide repeat protein [Paenibacillus xerothermodurans]|uniref:Tetratricopeptide repeat protein n=1 Tax=Paenibacillus xerothermodurans TaxID=1977292 RepID=A0A2W1NTB8_PAEXE|nr:tetratricopeptide repeat protein [Paenibacillus xerothermodurans]PZE21923.1 tetratricopeptide repeat protein [Paenibacillus xerothermodurans]
MDGEQEIKKAYASILMNDFEQAVEWFEQAIAIAPCNADFHHKLSITYARSNKLKPAVEHASLAVRLVPGEEQYRHHLQHLQAKELIQQAEKYLEESEPRLWEAISSLKQAVALDCLSTDAWLMLGLAYDRLREYDQAVLALKELLRLDPQHEIGITLLRQFTEKLSSI